MFLSWVKYHGRSAELASALSLPALFTGTSNRSLLRHYASSVMQTRRALRDSSSSTVFVMLPPAPALLSVILFRKKHTRIIADLHTGFFLDPKWKWFARIGLWLLREEVSLVTNSVLADIARRHGNEVIVLHDTLSDNSRGSGAITDGYILCPLSYANDEPVEALIRAAVELHDMNFLFTGRPPSWVVNCAPSNVSFSGYVSNEEFNELIHASALVCALTTRDLTMQRAGYEALMAGKPQVTSSFPVLRDFLDNAAVYVDPHDFSSIALGLKDAMQERCRLSSEVERVLVRRMDEQADTLTALRKLLDRHGREAQLTTRGEEWREI